jgi:hypothetical protein
MAFVVLTVAILHYLWEALGGEPLERVVRQAAESFTLLKDAHDSGLRRVVHTSGAFGDQATWMARLKNTKSNLDLMGYTLHVWSRGEDFETELVNLVRRGVNCRILIMDQANPNFSSVVNGEIFGITEASTKGEADGAEHLFTRIDEKVKSLADSERRGNFQFRKVIRGTILSQLCRTDGEMTWIPYLYSAVASRSPLFYTKGSDSGLFKVGLAEFEAMWALNPPAVQQRTEPSTVNTGGKK